MSDTERRGEDDACRFCGRTDYPHECIRFPVILNALYYCPDGERHVPAGRRWWQRKPRCERCGEAVVSGGQFTDEAKR